SLQWCGKVGSPVCGCIQHESRLGGSSHGAQAVLRIRVWMFGLAAVVTDPNKQVFLWNRVSALLNEQLKLGAGL
ncbi:hypothetical protein LDENG_00021980, partial [Lucifuga dentata]